MITAIVLNPAVDKSYFIDGFTAGGLYRVEDVVKTAGGKGINVARVSAALGEKVCALGFKAGQTGEWLENELKKLGVYTRFIDIKGESRTNINIIDNQQGLETEVLEIGPSITESDTDRFLEVFKTMLSGTEVLVCTGGLPGGIPSGFYGKLIDFSKKNGIKTLLDSSGDILISGIEAKPYMIKPNLRELSNYVGRKLDSLDEIIEACEYVLKKGVDMVLASLGRRGALLASVEGVLQAQVPDVPVISSIGSGDSMVAGFAAGIARGWDNESSFRLSVACGVANTQYREIGFVECSSVHAFFDDIIIRRVKG